MADFTINGVSYQSRLMDGETQIFVLKRLLPTFNALTEAAYSGVFSSAEAAPNADGSPSEEQIEAAQDRMRQIPIALRPVAKCLSEISDADMKYILTACCSVTSREVSNGIGWVNVVQRGGIQHNEDKSFIVQLKIAGNVIGENFVEMLAPLGVNLSEIVARKNG